MVKSHTVEIKQLLEEFNDDQMMSRLEAEAYEEERLATMNSRASTTNDHENEPTTSNTTEARQEGPVPVHTLITPDQQTATTNLSEPEPIEDAPRESTAIPDSTAKPQSPTPPSE